MNPQLEKIHSEIRDNFLALENGFQKLDKVRNSTRISNQLEELGEKMRECKRLLKEFDREIKYEEGQNSPKTNQRLNDEKQSMIEELKSYVSLRNRYISSSGNKKVELYDTREGANEPAVDEIQELELGLINIGRATMDKTDEAIEHSKKVVQQTVEVGMETLCALKGQTNQAERIGHELDTIQFKFEKALQLVLEIGGQVTMGICSIVIFFLLVCAVIAVLVVKIVNPHHQRIGDIPGLAPPVPAARRLMYTVL